MSKALELYHSTVSRSINLFKWGRKEQEELETAAPRMTDELHLYRDMGRAGVVLAVAAMDAYFTGRFTELVDPYLRSKLKSGNAFPGLVKLLQRAGLDVSGALGLLVLDNPYEKILAMVEGQLQRYTTQRFKAIDELFLCLGLEGICEKAQANAERDGLMPSVEALVQRRHRIVHSGDLDNRGKLAPLDFLALEQQIFDLNSFIQSADKIISKLESRLKRSG